MQPYIVVPVCIQLKLVTGVDQAIFEANASTLGGLTKNAFALMNGNPSNLFETLDGSIGKQVVNISQFASLLSTNGYKKFPDINSPSGFFIIQWLVIPPALGGQTFAFPIAFPNSCLGVFPCAMRTSEHGTATLVLKTNTGAVVNLFNFTNGVNTMGATIFAIGN